MTDSNQPNKSNFNFNLNNNSNTFPLGNTANLGSKFGNPNQEKSNSNFTFAGGNNPSTNPNNSSNDNKGFFPSGGLNLGSNSNSTNPSGSNNPNQNTNGTSTNLNPHPYSNPNISSNSLFPVTQPTTTNESNTQKPLVGVNNPFTLSNTTNTNTNPTTNSTNPTENKPSLFGTSVNQFQNANSEKQSQFNPINSTNSGGLLGNNQGLNGLEDNKSNKSLGLSQLTPSSNLAKSFSFGANQNPIAGNTTSNTNTTDKSAEPINNNANSSNDNQTNPTGFGGLFGAKSISNQPKTENVTLTQGSTSFFSKPTEPQKSSEPVKTGLLSGINQDSTQKSGFSFGGMQDKGISNTNQNNPLSKTSVDTAANQNFNPTIENKPLLGGNFFKTESNNNLKDNTTNTDNNTMPKISFGFDSKPTEITNKITSNTSNNDKKTESKPGFSFGAKPSESSTTIKSNDTGSIFNKEISKTENKSDQPTQNNITFGIGQTKKQSTDNTQATNKSIISQNPSDLFSSKPKTEGFQAEKKPETKEAEKKEEIADPKEMPKISNSLEEVAINTMMKKSIEEIINHWKNELDNQVDRFDTCADKLKNFEFMFRKHFETICSLYELINNLKEDGNNTLRNLKDISLEEDQIIEQLNIMEKSLDQYLEIADNRQPQTARNQFDGRDQIYLTATEIAKTVDDIQKDIDEVNSKISEGNFNYRQDNLNVLNYENPILRESISMDKNEFTNILNSYYASLRSIQFMEQNLVSKIMQAEVELNEIRRERERDKY